MDFPDLYKPERVGTWYEPRLADFLQLGRKAGPLYVKSNKARTLVLNVDNQCDFVLPSWALPVPGAVEDAVRFIEWSYKYLDQIGGFLNTFDLHPRKAIFHPTWWKDTEGNHPKPYALITSTDVAEGKWIPIYDSDWSIEYLRLVEAAGKELRIWPEHCIEGTLGQRLLPAIAEMQAFHTGLQGTVAISHNKGIDPHVEHFGAARAVVEYPMNKMATGIDRRFMTTIKSYDKVVAVGQAETHCVIDTLVQIAEVDPELMPRLYLLTDCTSPIPGYEEKTEKEFKRLESLGLHLATTKDSIF